MITVTGTQLSAFVAALIWPLTRILAMFVAAPVLGNPSLPMRVKIGLAVLLTVIITPTLPPLPPVDPGSLQGLLILLQQILLGVAMGFAIRLVFTAVEMAGDLAGLQTGFGFATFYDPLSASQIQAVSQFLGLLATLSFLAIDGHLLVIATLSESFRTFPIAADPLPALTFWRIADWGGQIFLFGLLLAMPVIAALLATNLALAVLARVSPQLNLFAIGFPITVAIGMAALTLSMPHLGVGFARTLENGLQMMQSLGSR